MAVSGWVFASACDHAMTGLGAWPMVIRGGRSSCCVP